MTAPILIQGGTFDPVHNAHLRTALDVARQLGVAQIRLLPCGDPPHRPPPGASAAQRLHMLQAAIEGDPRFVIDSRELQRAGPSYMVDTAAELRAEFGPQTPICLMMGMDAFLGLESWRHWRQLTGLLHLVVTQRPGWQGALEHASPVLRQWVAQQESDTVAGLLRHPAGRVLFVPVTQLDISATQVRAMLRAGQSPSYLVPPQVLRVIETENLYQNETE